MLLSYSTCTAFSIVQPIVITISIKCMLASTAYTVQSEIIKDSSLYSTVQAIVTTILIALLYSHIINHGSVVYLYHLQIRFHNQQYVFWFENDNGKLNLNNTDVTTPSVTTITTSYEWNLNNTDMTTPTVTTITISYGSNNNPLLGVPSNNVSVVDETSSAATMMMTSIQAYPSSLYYDDNIHDISCQLLYNNNDGGNIHDTSYQSLYNNNNNGSNINTHNLMISMITLFDTAFDALSVYNISSNNNKVIIVPVTYEPTSFVARMTTSYMSSSSHDDNDNDNPSLLKNNGNDSPVAVTKKTYHTSDSFGPTASSAVNDSTATSNAESDTDAMTAPAVMVEPYDIIQSPSAAIMKTTAPYTLYSMQHDTSVTIIDVQFSTGIMKTNMSYVLPSGVKMVTTDMNTAVYFAAIDVQSSTGITKTTTSYESPSDVMVKTIPFISNTDGRTHVVTTSPSVSTADATSSVTLSTRSTDVALKNYDTVYDLYFKSIFEHISTSYESPSTVIMKTTAPYMSYSIQCDIYSSSSVH